MELTDEQLERYARHIILKEVGGQGLSSYPHPWLMPKFWQFPIVSMGLGSIMSIYQARFTKYLINRGLLKDEDRKIWTFLGDGEMDEPESLGAIGLASREKLDNLIFVINCNLQRLDGPVRGNGKIIQELEGIFRGAGWNVIKVIWGSYWDPLIAKDKSGLLIKRMNECVDGEYQAFKAKGGAYVRENFFGKYPELKELVSTMTDADIWRLNRGGHDPHKVYAAYDAAMKTKGQPTVILAKTIKGYGMGKSGESINITHQQKKLGEEDLLYYRDRFDIPLSDKQVKNIEFYKPDEKSEEIKYIKERRMRLGGNLPERTSYAKPIKKPSKDIFENMLKSSGSREMSTTMALVRMLTNLLRDKNIASRLVPIIPDEARTFGMEGFFQKIGIYAHEGQKYEPVDSEQLSFYREDKKGQVLEEGITEAGAMSSWIAAGTAYTNHDLEMIPIYIFYSMFGFQRVMDLAWAAGDSQTRGFLIGATSGRTTLAGEGLQHQDGHSHLLIATSTGMSIRFDENDARLMGRTAAGVRAAATARPGGSPRGTGALVCGRDRARAAAHLEAAHHPRDDRARAALLEPGPRAEHQRAAVGQRRPQHARGGTRSAPSSPQRGRGDALFAGRGSVLDDRRRAQRHLLHRPRAQDGDQGIAHLCHGHGERHRLPRRHPQQGDAHHVRHDERRAPPRRLRGHRARRDRLPDRARLRQGSPPVALARPREARRQRGSR